MLDNKDIESARPVISGTRLEGILDIGECEVVYLFKPTEEGVYTLKYTRDTIDHAEVYNFSDNNLLVTNVETPRPDLITNSMIETVQLKKDNVYYIKLVHMYSYLPTKYSFEIKDLEVPSHNNREDSMKWDINDTIVNRMLYKSDIDWYTFTVPEDGEYKVIYSKLIDNAVRLYEGDSEAPKISSSDKIALIDDTVIEEYMFEKNSKYDLCVEHFGDRKLGEYMLKIKPTGVSVTYFDKF